ncbi:MAG: creatininase family protein [Gemmatimonadetes bacterium]|nr:creatininase family protein [Gemmatimonadota bacterium]
MERITGSDGARARALATMTWEEVRDLDRARAVAILPVGAIEAHGPHLPLSTDVVISEAMARAGAERLAADGVETVVLPPLVYTAAPFAAEFPGTLSVRPETVTALVVDLARALTAQGWRALALANAHLDPTHVGALRAAASEASHAGLLPVVFPDITRRRLAERLTEEFRSGACHAGQYETSIVLSVDASLVREELRGALPPVAASLTDAIRAGLGTFTAAGGERAYFGDPAAASAEEGARTTEVLGALLEEAVIGALESGES